MALSQGPKNPFDTLQAMLNGILIQTGKTLKTSNKNGGNGEIAITGLAESFQQVLDDFECDILRAKAVLLRDLNVLRSKRIAIENPTLIVKEIPKTNSAAKAGPPQTQSMGSKPQIMSQSQLHVSVKEEGLAKSPEKTQPKVQPIQQPRPPTKQEVSKGPIGNISQNPKGPQVPIPPASSNEVSTNGKAVSLSVKTDNQLNTSAHTKSTQDSALDSLFDIPNSGTADVDMNFDMDFSLTSTSQDQSQTQSNEFDLLSFGNSQDFSMSGLNPNTNSTIDITVSNKQMDDLLDFGTNTGGDGMDLDMNNLVGPGESTFDDMFFDDAGMSQGGAGDMEHGDFDNEFFGLDN